ncbi:hypothetical protein GCM10022232_64550 [Streptomyces plumbiresistens]|uniref:PPM-type phosphatase domain-containing protein n=1 Tax=Streptomyces plumbiresistens TaxID=511811 RepID=A0ABP7SLD6_9ACTN
MTMIPVAQLQQWDTDQAMLYGLFTQSPVQLTVFGPDGRVTWGNAAIEEQFGSRELWVGRSIRDLMPRGELLSPERAESLDEVIGEVFHTGEPVFDVHFRSPTALDPAHHHVWSASYFRLEDADRRPLGVCESAFEITDRYEAWQRVALLGRTSSIGRTLDMCRTADELATVVIPDFADAARVELAEFVLAGDDPPSAPAGEPPPLRSVVDRTADGRSAVHLYPSTPAEGQQQFVLPLQVGDVLLGRATFLRLTPRDPFSERDRALAAELVSRTAVCIDNARRYAREHTIALHLQRNLLPDRLPEPTGVEIAHHYAPAPGPIGVGGDWYDVIPLSGARVGLVVGDVAGHGLNAAATMGRLRTTVRALAVLDLDPGELLARLDDLVAQARIGIHPAHGDPREDAAIGARCLYAVYDPCSGQCCVASAGHLPPVVARPDSDAGLLDLAVGPLLGVGGLPFETTEFRLPEGSMLALFTDGLVQRPDEDLDVGVEELCRALSQPGTSPAEACSVIAASSPDGPAQDDAVLLLVRVQTLAVHNMASWPIDPVPEEVARARTLATDQLTKWGLEEATFVVELVVSELVTNAIRYGGAPVCLRLLRDQDRTLTCEVSDGGHTSPHLRRAGMDDEGGRGLFLVAQLTDRWGTRYTREGKTIWTELPLSASATEREIPLFG